VLRKRREQVWPYEKTVRGCGKDDEDEKYREPYPVVCEELEVEIEKEEGNRGYGELQSEKAPPAAEIGIKKMRQYLEAPGKIYPGLTTEGVREGVCFRDFEV
jgi:hypothetical protein